MDYDMYETGFISKIKSNDLRLKQNLRTQLISNLCDNRKLYPIYVNNINYGKKGNIDSNCSCTMWATLPVDNYKCC